MCHFTLPRVVPRIASSVRWWGEADINVMCFFYCPRRGRTVRCARAVPKVGCFGPVFSQGQGDRAVTAVFRDTGRVRLYSVHKLRQYVKTNDVSH